MISYSIAKNEDYYYCPEDFETSEENAYIPVDSYTVYKFVDGEQVEVDWGYSFEDLTLYLKDWGIPEMGEAINSLNMSKNIRFITIDFTVGEEINNERLR